MGLTQKAKTLFDTYHAKVPFVRQLSQDLSEFASNEGLLFTLGDRFCRFDKWESRDKEWNNEERKFEEWDPKAKEIKQEYVTILH